MFYHIFIICIFIFTCILFIVYIKPTARSQSEQYQTQTIMEGKCFA